MSNSLVKWTPPASDDRRKMDTALAKFDRGQIAKGRRQPAWGDVSVVKPVAGVVVDLLRICAIHDKPYMARYVTGDDGRFRHAQTFRLTETLLDGQYNANERRVIANADLAEESCPWCGGHGFGSVRCGKCGWEICYGKTTGRYFRCRDWCPGEGNIIPTDRPNEGLTPGAAYRGRYSAG